MGLEGRDPVRMGRMPIKTRNAVRPPDGTTFAQCMLDGFDVPEGGGLRLDVSIPFSRLHRASGPHEFKHQHRLLVLREAWIRQAPNPPLHDEAAAVPGDELLQRHRAQMKGLPPVTAMVVPET